MDDLRQPLVEMLQGRVCLVGVGNVECGDDGLGVRLAERCAETLMAQNSRNVGLTIHSGDTGAKRDASFPLTPTLSLGEREENSGEARPLAGASSEREECFPAYEPRNSGRESAPTDESRPTSAIHAPANRLKPALQTGAPSFVIQPFGCSEGNRTSIGHGGHGQTLWGESFLQGKGQGERTGSAVTDACLQRLSSFPRVETILAGTTPENHLCRLASSTLDQVLFLDALEFGGPPGAVTLLDSSEMSSRFPQISTHKLSLGLLAGLIESGGRTKVWLLGVQPESLAGGCGLTPKVRATVELLAWLLAEAAQEAREAYSPVSHRCPSEPSALPC
jgi:hydrogenase maturation protease